MDMILKLSNKRKKQKFTVVELIISIIVLGLLAGLAVPRFIGVKRNADVASLIMDIESLEKAIVIYDSNKNSLPLGEKITPNQNLLKAITSIGDSGEELYKINLEQSKEYHTNLKHGYDKDSEDYFVYSKESNRVFYAGGLMDEYGELVFSSVNGEIRNVKVADKMLSMTRNNIMKGSNTLMTGEVPANETIKVLVNNSEIPVEYENIAYAKHMDNIYAAKSQFKTFKSELIVERDKVNTIEVKTAKESKIFNVEWVNQAPQRPTIAMNVTGRIVNGLYEIILGASSIDPDGDQLRYEWVGKSENDLYTQGTHTVKVRAIDNFGKASEWTTKTFDTKDPMKAIFDDWNNYIKTDSKSGEWKYNSTSKSIYSTKNVGWTGFWNPEDVNLKDYKVNVSMAVTPNAGDDDNIGMAFRMQDLNNMYIFAFSKGTDSHIYITGLYKVTNGVVKKLVDYSSWRWNFNIWYNMKFEVVGNNIKIYNGENLIIDYTDNDNPFLTGGYGPFTISQQNGTFKNISVSIIND
ncbi:hypothetical protein [Alkaliphilus sp. B6464]|uniref:hypothetical protein n=1 Tax=Alkaliphilus sp. B6464 TaxID=2731219 RepID=UPI001BA65D02|nr:hypothetical protein [Alkaliphilus sp. B6464]QUH21977.1 hypothetical protein HYG84_18910 [Alkaliphilus sp. B6464]